MARKMALVPADFAAANQQLPPPTAAAAAPRVNIHTPSGPSMNQLSTLDNEMRAILDNNFMEPTLKLQNYYYTLKRYEAIRDNMGQRPSTVYRKDVPTPEDALSAAAVKELPVGESEILESLPRTVRTTGRLLLNFIKQNPDISWGPNKEMVYRGNPIPQSNIFDLVGDLARNRRSAHPPAGWKEFSEALIKQNVPRAAIGNDRRWEYIANAANRQQKEMPDPSVAETSPQDDDYNTAGGGGSGSRRRGVDSDSSSSSSSTTPVARRRSSSRPRRTLTKRTPFSPNSPTVGQRLKQQLKWTSFDE